MRFAAVALLMVIGCAPTSDVRSDVVLPSGPVGAADIFGTDDRVEGYAFAPGSPERRVADATAAMIIRSQGKVAANPDGSYSVVAPTLGQSGDLCDGEPYVEQPAAVWGAASLVGADLMITAGHVLTDQHPSMEAACADMLVVFDFEIAGPTADPQNIAIPTANVYGCREIVAIGDVGCYNDWAIVRLDRPVSGRTPLSFRREGAADPGTRLMVAGYPQGVPLKIAYGVVRAAVERNLEHDVDTFGGNSGSPIVNLDTLEVEGIHVCGPPPTYLPVEGRNCRVRQQCQPETATDACETWAVGTQVSYIASAIDEANGVEPLRPPPSRVQRSTPWPTVGQVAITEIFYNDSRVANDAGYEWVELYNPGAEPVELTGCVVDDAAEQGSPAATIPALVVPPNTLVVLAGAFSWLRSSGLWTPLLGDRGDRVELRCNNVLIDRVDYRGVGPDVSIALRPELLGPDTHLVNDRPESWCQSAEAYSSPRHGSPRSVNTCAD